MKTYFVRFLIWFLLGISAYLLVMNHEESPLENPTHFSARVIAEEHTQFNAYKVVHIDGRMYIAKSLSIPLGNTFYFRDFTLNKQFGLSEHADLVWRGKNIDAEVILNAPYSPTCDIVCSLIQQRNSVRSWFTDQWQTSLCSVGEQKLCSDKIMFAQGLSIGGTTPFSPDIKQAFIEQNLYHIVVVSGFQVAIIALGLERLSAYLKMPVLSRYLVIILILIFYGYITGFDPPIIRSLISFTFSSFILVFLGRKISDFLCLFYTAIICLVLFPYLALSVSWQLSIVATISILIVERFAQGWRWWITIPVTTVISFLFTLPITAQFGNSISPLALINNLILLPLIPCLTLLYLCIFIPGLGHIIAIPISMLTEIVFWLITSCTRLSTLNHWSFSVSSFNQIETIGYYLALSGIFIGGKFLCTQLTKMFLYNKLKPLAEMVER